MKKIRYLCSCAILILQQVKYETRTVIRINKNTEIVRKGGVQYMKELELKYGCNPNQKPSKNLYE